MLKRIAALSAALMLLVSCAKPSASSAAESPFDQNPVQSGIEFQFSDIEDSVFTMLYEPRTDAVSQIAYGLNMPDGVDCDWTGDTEYDSNFKIFDSESDQSYATVRVQTAPPNPKTAFGGETPEQVAELMRPYFFPVDEIYTSYRNSVINDFKYELVVDWTGTAFGWKAYYLEFIDDMGHHALRYYMCNDKLDETFYAFEFKADLPKDDQTLIDLYRAILFSMHEM